MPEGGLLSIGVSGREMDRPRDGRVWPSHGRYACITIQDSGTGMEPSVRERVFEPFFSTKATGVGTGLGMAIVDGLVKQHDGFIDVRSTAGSGTTIDVLLPQSAVAAGKGEAPTETAGDRATARGNEEMVLVVEDDAQLRESAGRALMAFGYRVLLAANGEEALDLFRVHGDEVDLVLSDLVMPKIGGRALYSALRDSGRGVPFVLMSGYAPGEIPRGSDLRGDIPHLTKPWTLEELRAIVRRALRRAGRLAIPEVEPPQESSVAGERAQAARRPDA